MDTTTRPTTLVESPYLRSLLVSPPPPSRLPNPHPLTIPGRRPSRHNSRHLALPPRHAQDPPAVLGRLLGRRRLPRHLQGHRQRGGGQRAGRRALLRHVRGRQGAVRGPAQARRARAGRELGRGRRVRGARADGGRQAARAGRAVSFFAGGVGGHIGAGEDGGAEEGVGGAV